MAEDDTLSWDDILAGRLAEKGEKAREKVANEEDDTLMGLPPPPTKPAPTAPESPPTLAGGPAPAQPDDPPTLTGGPAPAQPDDPPTLTGGPAPAQPDDPPTLAGGFLPQAAASPSSPVAQSSAAPALAGTAIPMTGIGVQEREALRVLSPEEEQQLRDYLHVRRRKRGARGAVSLLLSFLVLAGACAACFLWDPLHVWNPPALTAADQLHLDAFAPPWQPPPAADPDPLGNASP